MFWIWETVAITWLRKEISEISRLFLAMRMKRVLLAKPNPASNRCRTDKRKAVFIWGTSELNKLFVVERELLNVTCMAVPLWNA